MALNPCYFVPIGLFVQVVYYFSFSYVIKKFSLQKPDREDDDGDISVTNPPQSKNRDLADLARSYVDLLGGKENIREIESCITRIRLVLNDNSNLDEKALKSLGASGVMKAGNQVTQVIVGTRAQLIVDEMTKLLQEKGKYHVR